MCGASRRLHELTERQRKLQASRLVGELAAQAAAREVAKNVVFLGNTENFLDFSLAIDGLRLREDVSRNWTLVIAWRKHVDGDFLGYGCQRYAETRLYTTGDLVIVSAD